MDTRALASKVLDISGRLLPQAHGRVFKDDIDRWYLLSLLVFLARAKQNLEGVIALCNAGYGTQAMMVARANFELAFNLKFIAQDIPARITQYVEYQFIERHKVMTDTDTHRKAFPIQEPSPAQRADIISEYQRVRRNYDREFHWTGKSFRYVCYKMGDSYLYDLMYSTLCKHSHNSIMVSDRNVKQTPENALEVISGSNKEDSETALSTALACAIQIAGQFNEDYGLTLGDEIKAVDKLMNEEMNRPPTAESRGTEEQ